MTTFRWMAVVAAVVWCAGVAGGALASDTKQAKSEAKVAAPARRRRGGYREEDHRLARGAWALQARA